MRSSMVPSSGPQAANTNTAARIRQAVESQRRTCVPSPPAIFRSSRRTSQLTRRAYTAPPRAIFASAGSFSPCQPGRIAGLTIPYST